MKKWTGLSLIIVALVFILSNINTEKVIKSSNIVEKPEPKYEYGILVDTLIVLEGKVERGQTLGEILYANHIDHSVIADIVLKSKGIFDVRRVNYGKEYTMICADDSLQKAYYFIYQENPIDYIVISLVDSIEVYRGRKKVSK